LFVHSKNGHFKNVQIQKILESFEKKKKSLFGIFYFYDAKWSQLVFRAFYGGIRPPYISLSSFLNIFFRIFVRIFVRIFFRIFVRIFVRIFFRINYILFVGVKK